jgi:hypothetical protein
MPIDVNIPLGSPGIASFNSETYGGPPELFYSDTPQPSVTHHETHATATLQLGLGTVIAETGVLATVSGAVRASGTVTVGAGNAANGNTVTVGGVVYTFRTALTSGGLPNEVLIGGNVTASAENLVAAITGAAGAGTTYGTGTAKHPSVTATNSAGVVTVTAVSFGTIGNAITLAVSGANLSVSGATLASGANPSSNAFGVLATSINMAAGQRMSVPVYRSGHFNMLALTFDSSFDLEVEKVRAFQYSGSPSPAILISKPKFTDANINI